jgi:hypothetical protein
LRTHLMRFWLRSKMSRILLMKLLQRKLRK